jgi:hypothetical protein
MVCEMLSPRPVPCALVVKNGSNIFASTPGGMPVPVSITRTCWYSIHAEPGVREARRSLSRRPGLRGVRRRRTLRTS